MRNSRAVKTLGASNLTEAEREKNDYYATEPYATELLLQQEHFAPNVWECACGEGHMAKVLEAHGYNVMATDLIYRGFGKGGVDFLKCDEPFNGDIVTNAPFKYAQEFVEKALALVSVGNKVVTLARLQFLEGVHVGSYSTRPRPIGCMYHQSAYIVLLMETSLM